MPDITFHAGKYYVAKNRSFESLFSYSHSCSICHGEVEDSMYWIDVDGEIHANGWCRKDGLVELEWDIEEKEDEDRKPGEQG